MPFRFVALFLAAGSGGTFHSFGRAAEDPLKVLRSQLKEELSSELKQARANLEVDLLRVQGLQERLAQLDPVAAAAAALSPPSSQPFRQRAKFPAEGRCGTLAGFPGSKAVAELTQDAFEEIGRNFLLERPCAYAFPLQGFYPIEWTCDLMTVGGRDGPGTDGAYRLCKQPALFEESGCVIYSFGLANDPSFDLDLANMTNCSVYAFDKAYRAQQEQHQRFGWTLREPRTELTPANYHYIPIWLHGLKPGLEDMTLRLPEIMQLLGHRRVDVMKLDVECSEFERGLVETICDIARPMQLTMEMHGYGSQTAWGGRQHCTREHWVHFLNELHQCGYRRIWDDASGMNPELMPPDFEWQRCQELDYCKAHCEPLGAKRELVAYSEVSFILAAGADAAREGSATCTSSEFADVRID